MSLGIWYASGKAVSLETVSPNDTAEVHYEGLYVGTSGDVEVQGKDDSSAVVLKNVEDGEFLPICVKKVLATNTTASNIVGLRAFEGK